MNQEPRIHELVFWENGRGWEAGINAVSDIFLAGYLDLGPVAGADADNATGTNALNDQVGLELDLDSAAPQRYLAVRL